MASDDGLQGVEAVTTGVVIVDHGSRRAASNEMLERFVARFAEQHATAYPIVEPAHMELAEPSIATAFDRCVQRGAARIAVCPYFLAPGKHWHQDIPNLAREAALQHPHVSYAVTAPIGLSPMIQDVIASQLGYCLGQIDGARDECEWCQGTGRCAMRHADETEPVVFHE
ncbi:MAG: CbiX/SirB N-terminal domain-containing protein [Planctomycetota bacterium]